MTEFFDKEDSVLVQLTLLGDENAYAELVTRHERSVKGTAYKVTHNSHSAEDASQDAFVSAWMNLSALRDGNRFGAWVCSIAKNHARTLEAHYRSSIPSISFEELEGWDFGEDGTWADDAETSMDLHEAVNALSEKIRETITLHYFEDLSIKEIAKRLSVSEGTVKWRLSEGRKQLRKGYGIMEKTYNENESLVARVLRQVEHLKLWRLKNDLTGFEAEYRVVLASVEALDDSKEKSHALADTLLLGYWWLPGEKNDAVLARIKQAALEGHNDEVMSNIAYNEHEKLKGQEKIDYMKNVQIPFYREHDFPKSLAYVWFWLGYTYRCEGKIDQAIEAFTEVLWTAPTTDVYYANAKAAIAAEERMRKAKEQDKNVKFGIHTSGEDYRYLNDKLYFWTQPGYSDGDAMAIHASSLFWNASACENLIYDPQLQVGESVTASGDGEMVLTCLNKDGICETPAGRFEHCSVFAAKGQFCRLTYCETWFCPGVGIVKQVVERDGKHELLLTSYQIQESSETLPFAVGNRWSYQIFPETEELYESELVYEVTGMEQDTVTMATFTCIRHAGYRDTWGGKMLAARQGYAKRISDSESELLTEVRPLLTAAQALAVTKRQKRHTEIASRIMDRIFDTDPDQNPDYTQGGRWNFFSYEQVHRFGDKIDFIDDRVYSFEWKNMKKHGKEGQKVLYSFFDSILSDAMGCMWSEEWTDGYRRNKRVDGKNSTDNISVDIQDVTVPAGTFTNCRHLSFDFKYRYSNYFNGHSEYWFAPGVGIVKFVHPIEAGFDAVWQLTEYRGVGEGYFPIGDGFFRRYEPQALGDGWCASVEYLFDEEDGNLILLRDAVGVQAREAYEKAMK